MDVRPLVTCVRWDLAIVTLAHTATGYSVLPLLPLPSKLELPLLFSEDPGRLHASHLAQPVPAVLTVLPGLERHLAITLLDTVIRGVIPRLDGSSEESSTRRTNLMWWMF